MCLQSTSEFQDTYPLELRITDKSLVGEARNAQPFNLEVESVNLTISTMCIYGILVLAFFNQGMESSHVAEAQLEQYYNQKIKLLLKLDTDAISYSQKISIIEKFNNYGYDIESMQNFLYRIYYVVIKTHLYRFCDIVNYYILSMQTLSIGYVLGT